MPPLAHPAFYYTISEGKLHTTEKQHAYFQGEGRKANTFTPKE